MPGSREYKGEPPSCKFRSFGVLCAGTSPTTSTIPDGRPAVRKPSIPLADGSSVRSFLASSMRNYQCEVGFEDIQRAAKVSEERSHFEGRLRRCTEACDESVQNARNEMS